MHKRTVKQLFLSPLNHVLYLFFPRVCACCKFSLYSSEEVICTRCLHNLPRTNLHLIQDNRLEQTFWGRSELKAASAFLYFRKKGKVQKLIHQFKYKSREEIGLWLGNQYGSDLKKQNPFAAVEMIIPVPLHPKKLKRRGYNQSEVFARGLAEQMHKPVSTKVLLRKMDNASQTGFSRYLRWENTKEIFYIKDQSIVAGRHVLLVDDVITTGATIEACSHLLNEAGAASVTVAAICYTN